MIAGSARAAAGSSRRAGDDVRPTKDIVREAVFSALDAARRARRRGGARPLRGDRRARRSRRCRGARRGAVLVERDRRGARRDRARTSSTLGFARPRPRSCAADVGRVPRRRRRRARRRSTSCSPTRPTTSPTTRVDGARSARSARRAGSRQARSSVVERPAGVRDRAAGRAPSRLGADLRRYARRSSSTPSDPPT